MVNLSGNGVISKVDSKTVGDFTNYTYEVMVSASRANKNGVIPTTTIRLSGKNFNVKAGDGVKFNAEMMPYTKKDGSGTSYFFKAIQMAVEEVKLADNTPSLQDDLDDAFPPF